MKALIVTCLIVLCVAARGDANSTPIDGALRDDPRLDRRFSLNETGISLEELCAKLTDRSLKLDCASSVRKQKVEIRLRERKLSSALSLIAEMLPGEWNKSGDGGYTLQMASDWQSKRDQWWRLYASVRAAAVRSQQDSVLRCMRNIESAPGSKDDRSGNAPDARKRFFESMPGELQERVSRQISECPLDRVPGGPVNVTLEDLVVVKPEDLGPESLASLQSAPRIKANSCLIGFFNSGNFVGTHALSPNNRVRDLPFFFQVPEAAEWLAVGLDHRELVRAVEWYPERAPPTLKRLAEFQKSTVWPTTLGTISPLNIRRRRAEVLNWLADRANLEFVADYYSVACRPLTLEEKSRIVTGRITDELNICAAEDDLSWKQSAEGPYLLRNNRWYRDDLLEAPNTTLKQLNRYRLQHYESSIPSEATGRPDPAVVIKRMMEYESYISRRLSRLQIANGLYYFVSDEIGPDFDPMNPKLTWRPFAQIAEQTLQEHRTALFYSSLAEGQRSALRENRLPIQ